MASSMKTIGSPLRLRRSLSLCVFALVTHVASCPVVRASFPHFLGDGELVDRSELIVIGSLQGDSVRKIAHSRGFSSEHHATLVIKDILKGDFKDQQITLLIQHGLEVTNKEGKVRLE